MTHPAIVPGNVAIITGAASGIGLAAARRFAGLGMVVVMADVSEDALEREAAALRSTGAMVTARRTDVSDPAGLATLRDLAVAAGPLSLLMNNAARSGPGAIDAGPAAWHATLDTNLWGCINGVQAFLPIMRDAGRPAAIVNTGSKQGITTPPGNTAYNVSKAAIKALTEGLAHDLLGSPITAHLLIPGFTYTGLTGTPTKPDGAWTADQVVDRLLAGLDARDFYILCPDNDTTRAQDEKRMAWAIGDIIHNRPALSRWHPDHKAAFDAFMAG